MLKEFLNPNDPVFVFTILLFSILFFPNFFAKIKLPPTVGLIIAGILIGPHTLGLINSTFAFE